MPRLALNRPVLDQYLAAENIHSDAELARRMQVNPSTVSRLLAGTQAPGPAVIAGFRTAFPRRRIDRLITTTK